MTIAVIVPTKNRAKDLVVAVRSVLTQTVLPTELIVVDQSVDGDSEQAVKSEVETAKERGGRVELQYIHDPAIAGANPARNAGIRAARSDIAAVIEDDIVLDPFAIERLLDAYRRHPHLLGMSGVITNYPPPPLVFRLFERLFSLGPLHDDRQPLYWRWKAFPSDTVVPITQMGGLMTFRTDAIAGLEFDESRKVLRVRGEDRDFCFQVSGRAGRGRHVFGMAMGSRLTHNPSPVGRYRGRLEELLVVSQHYFYSRHLRGSMLPALFYAWWNLGIIFSALGAACRRGSLEPVRALRRGWRRIREGYIVREAHASASQQESAYA